MPGFSLKKGERLSSRKAISSLFQSGKTILASPLKIRWEKKTGLVYPASMAVSVPKRMYKKAVDRNLLKRRIREAYRINKPFFYSRLNEIGDQVYLVIQYQHRDVVDFRTIEAGLNKALDQLIQELQ
jgi:ribonuclease P protein component